jgi:hypothetical protein
MQLAHLRPLSALGSAEGRCGSFDLCHLSHLRLPLRLARLARPLREHAVKQ